MSRAAPLRIRDAQASDLPAILDIYNHAILTTTAVYSYEPHTLEMRRAWFDEKRQAGFPVLVAEDAGQVLGFSALGAFRAWPAYKYTAENSVYVAEAARGRGIGRQLLEPLVTAARALDLHAIVAGIDATNAASLRLHASLGFTEVARFREVGYKFGRWLDLTFMELLLETPAAPIEGPARR